MRSNGWEHPIYIRTDLSNISINNILEQFSKQIRRLSEENEIGLVDSYEAFKKRVIAGDDISIFMSQSNHPNEKGHRLIAGELVKYFK